MTRSSSSCSNVSLSPPVLPEARGDGPTFATFVIRPDEAGVRRHFDVPTEELHRLV